MQVAQPPQVPLQRPVAPANVRVPLMGGATLRNGNGFNPGLIRTLADFTTSLIGRLDFSNRAGLTFGTSRDLYSALGYKRVLTIDDYRSRYTRGGIAERIVEAYPRGTWSAGAVIVENPDPSSLTLFEQSINTLFSRLHVWSRLKQADILAQIARYSVLLIGAPGDPRTPLPDNLTIDDIYFLKPYAEDHAAISEYYRRDTNGSVDSNFGRPKFYNLSVDIETTQVEQMTVHESRLIHVAEGGLENDIYGKPRLRAIWNYLDDLEKVSGGGSEAAWKRMDPGMQIDVDPEMELDEDEESALAEEVERYKHGVDRVMRTRGTKITLLSSQVQGFGPNVASLIDLISATTGIPQRILMGTERGELSSTQDRDNWADRVTERRREFAELLVRQLISRFIEHNIIPAPATTAQADIKGNSVIDYAIEWPEIGGDSIIVQAEAANKLAAANQAQYVAGQPQIITANEIRRRIFKLGPLKTEDAVVAPREPASTNAPNAPVNGAAAGT